jgi:hypothetical protein
MLWFVMMKQFKFTLVPILRWLEETQLKLIGCSKTREGLVSSFFSFG